MIRASTRALIEEAFRHSAVYRNGFANHLPMALIALDAMGATEAESVRFTRSYEVQLEPVAAGEVARVTAIEQSLARDGTLKVIRDLSPLLARGIGSVAFHGAIRTAYAVESDRKSTRLNSSHIQKSRMPSSA